MLKKRKKSTNKILFYTSMERERHIEDLKKIASLSKNKKNVKTQKQRNLLGKNVITAIKGIGCRPDKVFYLSLIHI